MREQPRLRRSDAPHRVPFSPVARLRALREPSRVLRRGNLRRLSIPHREDVVTPAARRSRDVASLVSKPRVSANSVMLVHSNGARSEVHSARHAQRCAAMRECAVLSDAVGSAHLVITREDLSDLLGHPCVAANHQSTNWYVIYFLHMTIGDTSCLIVYSHLLRPLQFFYRLDTARTRRRE